MLQTMRERIQGIIATVIIVVLCLAFALWGIQYYIGNRGASDSVATVNGVKISRAQFTTAYDRAKQSFMMQMGSSVALTQDMQNKLKQSVLQQMINNQILAQQAEKQNLSISPDQISSVLTSIPAFQVNGKFSPSQFQAMLSRMLYSEDQFLNDLKQNMLVNQLQTGIVNSSFSLPDEVTSAVKLAKQQRDISYAIIPLAKFKNIITISDADIQKFYQTNQQQFGLPEQVSISYIQLTADSIKNKVQPTAKDLQQFYNDNLASFSQPYAKVQEKVKKAYTQQKLNQLFDEASQKLSDLAYTNSSSLAPAADQLGLKIQTTGLFTKDGEKTGLLANQKIVKAAFSDSVLQQSYNSDPLEINSGEIMVLRVKEHKPETFKTLAEVRPFITQQLFSQVAQQKAGELAGKILQDLHQGKTFIEVLQAQGLTLKTLSKVNFQTKAISPEMIQAALYLPLPTGKPSYGSVGLKDGSFAIIAVNNVYPGEISQLSAKQIQGLTTNMAIAFGQVDFSLFTNKYIKSAKVKKSE